MVVCTGAGQRVQFPFNNWLQGNQQVKLTTGGGGENGGDGRVTFKVAVTTSDVRGAGQ